MSNSNGFLIDNSPSTQLKYDIVASKFVTGTENHHKLNAHISLGNNLGLIGAVLQIIISLVAVLGLGLHWVIKRLF